METGLKVCLALLAEKVPYCTGIAIGDTESDTGVAYLCPDDERRDFLIRMTDFAAAQLREQTRFFRVHCESEHVHGLSGVLCDSRYAIYPIHREGMEGLFLVALWERSAGNSALVDAHFRNWLPLVTLNNADKSQLYAMRREAWEDGTSGLLTRMQRSAASPVERRRPTYADELLPFEQSDAVLRLLGLEEDELESVYAAF